MVIVQVLEVFRNFSELNPGEKQININPLVNKLNARDESFFDHDQISDALSPLQDTRKYTKEMAVSINVAGSHHEGVNISAWRVDAESIRTKLENLPA